MEEGELRPVVERPGGAVVFRDAATIRREGLRAKVAWGFVLDERGRLLIHRRGPAATDNRLLWDKSFGGHMHRDDATMVACVLREAQEELAIDPAAVGFAGYWHPARRRHKRDDTPIALFQLTGYAGPIFHTSRRQLPDGGQTDMPYCADAFVFCCRDGASCLQNAATAEGRGTEIADARFISLPDLRAEVAADPARFTSDMGDFMRTDRYGIKSALAEIAAWWQSTE